MITLCVCVGGGGGGGGDYRIVAITESHHRTARARNNIENEISVVVSTTTVQGSI